MKVWNQQTREIGENKEKRWPKWRGPERMEEMDKELNRYYFNTKLIKVQGDIGKETRCVVWIASSLKVFILDFDLGNL